MNVNSKRLAGTQVVTSAGQLLGKLASLDFDGDTGHLVAIRVSTGLVKGLLSDELVIAWNQIVEITSEKITVTDTAIPGGASVIAIA
jgi:uncharacterized protein YrrD